MGRFAVSWLLAICLVALAPVQSEAYTSTTYHVEKHYISGVRKISGATYELYEDGTAVFCKPASKSIVKLKVPARVVWAKRAYKVTEIASSACEGCKKLEHVVVGKNVVNVGANAFKGCKGLLKFTSRTKRITLRMLKAACVL